MYFTQPSFFWVILSLFLSHSLFFSSFPRRRESHVDGTAAPLQQTGDSCLRRSDVVKGQFWIRLYLSSKFTRLPKAVRSAKRMQGKREYLNYKKNDFTKFYPDFHPRFVVVSFYFWEYRIAKYYFHSLLVAIYR